MNWEMFLFTLQEQRPDPALEVQKDRKRTKGKSRKK
jgi:hypothetical protein